MADLIETLEVELARSIRSAEDAERRRLDALAMHQRADADAQQANRWRDSVAEAIECLRDAFPQSLDSRSIDNG